MHENSVVSFQTRSHSIKARPNSTLVQRNRPFHAPWSNENFLNCLRMPFSVFASDTYFLSFRFAREKTKQVSKISSSPRDEVVPFLWKLWCQNVTIRWKTRAHCIKCYYPDLPDENLFTLKEKIYFHMQISTSASARGCLVHVFQLQQVCL